MYPGVGRLLLSHELEDKGASVFRTGFVIVGQRVLTAAHCVRMTTGGPVVWLRLPLPTGARDFAAPEFRYLLVPLEIFDLDTRLDVALLVVHEALPTRPQLPNDLLTEVLERIALPLSIDAPAGTRVRTEGFPVSAGNPDGRVFTGRIADGNAMLGKVRALELFLHETAASLPESPKGHSGGPVLRAHLDAAKEVVVGIVRGFPKGDQLGHTKGGALYATRMEDLTRRFPTIADAVAANVQISLASSQRVDTRTSAKSLTDLLRADAEVSAFHGRTEELKRLTRWCDEPLLHSAWLLVGPAGQGKTRLARRFLAILQKQTDPQEWIGGLVRGPGDISAIQDMLRVTERTDKKIFLVVDYAAEHGADSLAELVATLAESRVRSRLLLLARAVGTWWTDSALGLRSRLERRSFDVQEPALELQPLASTNELRRELFLSIIHALKEPVHRFALTHPSLEFVPDPVIPVLGPEFGSALMLHVAAVCALLPATRPGDPPRASEQTRPRAAELVDRILDLELVHHWLYADPDSNPPKVFAPTRYAFGGPPAARQVETAVAAATLAGATNRVQATKLVSAVLQLDPARAEAIADWLHDLYPDDGTGSWLPPLQPDLFGEELVARVIRRTLTDDRDPPTETLPFQILFRSPSDTQVRQLITVLVRAAPRHSSIAKILDGTYSAESTSLLDAVPADVDLAPIERSLPEFTTALLTFNIELTRRVIARRKAATPPKQQSRGDGPAKHARLQHNLATRLGEAGLHREALNTAVDAVRLFRQLVITDVIFLPDLASSLGVLASELGEFGRKNESLEAARESVGIRRRLVNVHGDRYLFDLALSLNRLANHLAGRGFHSEAVACAHESVSHFRRLNAETPDIYLSDLGMSLNTYANRLAGTGRDVDALEPALESVAIRRRLAAASPDAYLPSLADSLNNCSLRLENIGRHDTALGPIREAVTIWRELTETVPEVALPKLAAALNNYGSILATAGRHDEALQMVRESVEIRQRLSAAQPGIYRSALASSLNNLASRLAAAALPAEALERARESVAIYQQLAEVDPAGYLPDLATALNNFAKRLAHEKRYTEALEQAGKSIQIRRLLTEKNPGRHGGNLASSLHNLSVLLVDSGRRSDSPSVAQEAVDIYRKLAVENPGRHRKNLAASLLNLGDRLADAARHSEALGPIKESLIYYRRLAKKDPQAYIEILTVALNNYCVLLRELNRRAEVPAIIDEIGELHRRLDRTNVSPNP